MVPPLRGFFFGKYVPTRECERVRLRVQVAAHQLQIADRGGHQDVGLAAARDEISRDVLVVAHHVLRGCGLVIDVARIDVRAMVEQQLRNVDGRRDSAAASGRHRRARGRARAFGEQPVERLDMPSFAAALTSTTAPRSMRIGNEDPIRAMEHAESAGPPAAPDVDIGAGLQQCVDHIAAPLLHRLSSGVDRRTGQGSAR